MVWPTVKSIDIFQVNLFINVSEGKFSLLGRKVFKKGIVVHSFFIFQTAHVTQPSIEKNISSDAWASSVLLYILYCTVRCVQCGHCDPSITSLSSRGVISLLYMNTNTCSPSCSGLFDVCTVKNPYRTFVNSMFQLLEYSCFFSSDFRSHFWVEELLLTVQRGRL